MKDQFEWTQELLSKGETTFGIKTGASEAEIKEDLKPALSTTALSVSNTIAQDHLRIQPEVRRVVGSSALPGVKRQEV